MIVKLSSQLVKLSESGRIKYQLKLHEFMQTSEFDSFEHNYARGRIQCFFILICASLQLPRCDKRG